MKSRFLLLAGLLLALASCDWSLWTTKKVSVEGVFLNKTSTSIIVDGTEQLTATVFPLDATNKAVSFSTDNASIATVTQDGLISAIAPGSATITVSTEDGLKTASCLVAVSAKPIAVASVSLKTATSIVVDGTETLYASIAPSNASNQTVAWSSANSSIVEVSQGGVITGKAAGSTSVTVTTADGSKTASCIVTVSAKPISVTGVTLSKHSTRIIKGEFEQLTATISPASATNQNLTWSSNNEDVAIVGQNGNICAFSVGSATITVTTQDGNRTDSCEVAVFIPVTGVTLNKPSTSITKGLTETLTAVVAPDNATDKALVWSSGNESVATVSQAGLISAIELGDTTITVTTHDGSHIATCDVTVLSTITGVTLNKLSTTLDLGHTETLTATVAPVTAFDKSVSWTSNNTTVATVSSSGTSTGVITAHVQGNAIITATTADGSHSATCAVHVRSHNANLSSLSVSGGSVSPAFSAATLSYRFKAETNSATFTVTPTCADSDASVTVNGASVSSGGASGSLTIASGDSTIPIVVTAEDGTTATYSINTLLVQNLIAHWPLTSNMNDSGPNGFDGVWGGHPTPAGLAAGLSAVPEYVLEGTRTGIHFRSTCNSVPATLDPDTLPDPLHFVGAGDFVNVEPNGPDVYGAGLFDPKLSVSDYITVSFWIFLDPGMNQYYDGSGTVVYEAGHNDDSDHMNIINKAVWFGCGWQVRYGYCDDTLTLLLHRNSAYDEDTLATNFMADNVSKWANVTVTIDNTGTGTVVNGYINGVQTLSNYVNAHNFNAVPINYFDSYNHPRQNVGNLSIGAYSHAWGGLSVNGKMSDVRIYHGVLTPAQVAYLYNLQ